MSAVAHELRDITFRPMREADLDEVLTMEREAYEFPWSRQIFRDCLRAGYSCRVLESGGVVNAYGLLQFASGTSRLLNLCVRRAMRRQGLGRGMLTRLLETARSHRAEAVVLEVRPSNTVARRLYGSMGFAEAGISDPLLERLHRD